MSWCLENEMQALLAEESYLDHIISQLSELKYRKGYDEFLKDITKLLDELKDKYGRDIFGKGYIFRLIDDDQIADIDTLSQDEKENGISTKKKYYVSSCNVEDKQLYDHPTIKPENIISNLIINSSKEEDIVLDTFMGSGTTAVCAKNLNRHFIGFELNPQFHKIACDRLNGITQQDIKDKEFEKIKLF